MADRQKQAFRPTTLATLEDRALMSTLSVRVPSTRTEIVAANSHDHKSVDVSKIPPQSYFNNFSTANLARKPLFFAGPTAQQVKGYTRPVVTASINNRVNAAFSLYINEYVRLTDQYIADLADPALTPAEAANFFTADVDTALTALNGRVQSLLSTSPRAGNLRASLAVTINGNVAGTLATDILTEVGLYTTATAPYNVGTAAANRDAFLANSLNFVTAYQTIVRNDIATFGRNPFTVFPV